MVYYTIGFTTDGYPLRRILLLRALARMRRRKARRHTGKTAYIMPPLPRSGGIRAATSLPFGPMRPGLRQQEAAACVRLLQGRKSSISVKRFPEWL